VAIAADRVERTTVARTASADSDSEADPAHAEADATNARILVAFLARTLMELLTGKRVLDSKLVLAGCVEKPGCICSNKPCL
jgi:hypothetical protein